jgi:hypothetical protein
MRLDARQHGVARGMGAALAIAILLLVVGLRYGTVMAPVDRFARVGAGAAVMALWLAAAIGNVARLRFFSPQDIGAARGAQAGGPVARAVAILQNTLEQYVLAVAAQVGLAVAFDRAELAIALLAGSFSVGRALFWTGYARGAAARAFGFALTFYPSVLALLSTVVALAV